MLNSRLHSKRLLTQLLSFALVILFAACDDNESSGFPQPETIHSSDGVLEGFLETRLAENTITNPETGESNNVVTPTYNGNLIGPTLRVKPGDTINLDIFNNFPENTHDQRSGAFPHGQFTTNIHTHGLTVDPGGISDNVFREMTPGNVYPVEVKIPSNHECGTFWYHPHKHGSVSYQFFGGMSGFLIIEDCEGGLDNVPEVKAAEERLMAFQVIRTDDEGKTPFVNMEATQQNSDQNETNGLWSNYIDSKAYFTTNGVLNPVVKMKPGEIQRWRMLNTTSGLSLALSLENHQLHVIANDGLTVENMVSLDENEPYLIGTGNRVDLLVKAGEPGVYELKALDPSVPRSVTYDGIDPAERFSRIGGDFPDPEYPITLATVVVEGDAVEMDLPEGPLPYPRKIPGVQEMLETEPDAERNVVFEICGKRARQQDPDNRLPSCGWYFNLYDDEYWGGEPFTSILMMRDGNDKGIPSIPFDPEMPRIDYLKEGSFHPAEPLFGDMYAGNFEEWTIENRTNSDHTFHIHINPFLITHINGKPLEVPQWRDTILVPAATGGNSINDATFGSITFRTWFDPRFTGSFVMHCHILTHEDVGMMQRLDILERPAEE